MMRRYLRVVNPIVAVAVLGLCMWAGMDDSLSEKSNLGQLIEGGIPTYFLAKGLFCSSALFILGKILEVMLDRKAELAP